MDLLNRTPFAAERFVFLHEGLEMLLVVVKGTFAVHSQGTTGVAGGKRTGRCLEQDQG
ncbi:MAG TPA: hypothetical protein VEU33_13070 [Archangium sp.]|nr:hypothetical protein [Archangium sp.]